MAHKHVRLFPIIGISIAVQTIVGQAQGMDRPDISVKCGWRGIGLAQIWMITLGVIFLLFPNRWWPYSGRKDMRQHK